MSKFLFFDENKEILRRLIEKRFHLAGDAIIAGPIVLPLFLSVPSPPDLPPGRSFPATALASPDTRRHPERE
ncbi:hypothetical protein R5M74_09915 [Aeromonas hydrophila]|nr:hypothetical protein R5M74_09915 [Aeromonas hydrophila]